MTQSTDQDIRDIKSAVEANNKAISDLVTSFMGLREEMRVGFANVETKLAEVRGEIKAFDTKFEELTKIGFWGFVFRGATVSLLAGILLVFLKFLFPTINSLH